MYSAPRKEYLSKSLLVLDVVGIEPMTSSMPYRSHGPNNRRHSTYEPAQPAELTPWALFAHKMPPNFWEEGQGLICVGSAFFIVSIPFLQAKELPIIVPFLPTSI